MCGAAACSGQTHVTTTTFTTGPIVNFQLNTSSLCLQRYRAQAAVIPAVKALLRDMASLSVLEHSKALLLRADDRGSDVQLRTGPVLDGSQGFCKACGFSTFLTAKWLGLSPSCCRFIVKQCHRSFPLDSFRVAAQRCGVTVVPKHATVLVVSSGVMSYSSVFTTPHSRVTPWLQNLAVVVNLISTLGNTPITFFTMIALPIGVVIRWQPFGASYLPGATALTWRKKAFLRNWSRTQNVRRAVLPSQKVLLGFCGFDALFGWWRLVGALYLVFCSCCVRERF